MDLLFFIAGIALLSKKEVRISKNKVLSGRHLKILAVIYILPFTFSFVVSLFLFAKYVGEMTIILATNALGVVAVLTTLYYIRWHKSAAAPNPTLPL